MAYHPMNVDEVRDFLNSTPPRTAKLATVRSNGRPHVAPIWFAVDDAGDIVFCTGADTVKGRNLVRNRWAALCVDDDRPPFSFVTIEGPVSVEEDLESVRHWAAKIGGRYMGQGRAEEYGDRNGVPGELLVRLRPEKVISAADLALPQE